MPKWIKITLLIIAVIILFLYALNEYVYYQQSKKDNVEGTNVNLNFIDKLGYHYMLQVTCQNPDGSIYVVSGMSDRSWYKDYISIIKLSPEAKVLWETKTRFEKFNWKDFLPRFIRQSIDKDHDLWAYGVCGISVLNDKLYLLVFQHGKTNKTFKVWQFSLTGQLEKKMPVSLQLNNDLAFATAVQNDIAYLSYLDEKTNTINLDRIGLTDGSLKSSVNYKPEHNLKQLVDMWSDSSGVLIAAEDSKTIECRLYLYEEKTGITEYYNTKPQIRIESMYFKDGIKIAAVQEDSLLKLIDITKLPARVILENNLGFFTWAPIDLELTNNYAYVFFLYTKKDSKKKENVDCMVRKYSLADNKFEGQFTLQGSSLEMPKYIYVLPDKQVLVLGTSFSTSNMKTMRVFATKFKL